ncbi:MAG: hypothetical protein ACKO2Z_01205 [Sphaerospermopsis kisseleviana]
MTIDIRAFYKATNPARTLVAKNPEDQKVYIDFSELRGENIITTLLDQITLVVHYSANPNYK